MTATPTALLVSLQFAPSTLAGVHRTRHLARRLPEHGWRPVMVRTDEAYYTERLDPELDALVAPELDQVRVRALPARLGQGLGIGDIGLRTLPYLGAALDAAVIRFKPQVVLFTGFPFYPMLLAGRMRRRHRLPVVLDFQDPWVSAFGAVQPALSKAGLAHRLAVWLEPQVLRHADFITGVSQVQNDEMARRYAWLDTSRMAAIPIGGEPDDFQQIARGEVEARDGIVELRYVGAFWPRAEPVLRQLFKGLALLRERDPATAARLRLSFTGTASASRAGIDEPRPVEAIAREEGLADFVREDPRRVPFVEALRLMATSSGLLLTGSDEPHYSASKIYSALMAKRPYLSIFHARSSAHQVLSTAGGGLALGFDGEAELTALPSRIAEGLARMADTALAFAPADERAYAAYTATAIAGRYAAIFERLAAERDGV